MSRHPDHEASRRVRIPADIDRPDRLLAGLTARQLALLAVGVVAGYALFAACRVLLPLPVAAGLATPPVLAAGVVAFAGRDGLSGDQYAAAAIRYARTARTLVPAPAGVAPLPPWAVDLLPAEDRRPVGDWALPIDTLADAVDTDVAEDRPLTGIAGARAGAGGAVVGLGPDGSAVLAIASCLNFSLRSPVEQDQLTTVFGHFLNASPQPLQILLRAHPLDLTPLIRGLEEAAAGMPHPALEAAAREHAGFLEQLTSGGVLHRQAVLILRDPRPPADAAPVLRGWLADATASLSRAGIRVQPLDAAAAADLIATAADPTASSNAPALGSWSSDVLTADLQERP